MRMCSIASGSSGNCIYVGSDNSHLLIDTGISKKRIEEGLNKLEIKGDELDGILITHEHSDHIKGLGVFSRKYEIPIYATPGSKSLLVLERCRKDFYIRLRQITHFSLVNWTYTHLPFLMMQMNRQGIVLNKTGSP